MISLTAARSNHIRCNCRLCSGQYRDKRTVRRHYRHHPYPRNSTLEIPQQTHVVNEVNDDPIIEEQQERLIGVDDDDESDENDDYSDIEGDEENVNGDVQDDIQGGDRVIDFERCDNDDGDENSDNQVSTEEDSGADSDGENSDEDEQENDSTSDSSGDNNDGNGRQGVDGEIENDEGNAEPLDRELEKCILRIIASKIKYGWSQEETLNQLQSLYEFTNNNHIPHETWPAVMNFLKKLGYKNPKHYKICCGKDHVTFIDGDKCPNCNKLKHKCVDYFVLGLNLESIFLSQNKIHNHLAHWEEKVDWFNKENITVPLKEVWHGARFCELSYFWDELKETILPTCCPNCYNIISVEQIASVAGFNGLAVNERVNLSCSECTFDFIHIITSVKGNLLNQAFIFHEDGFNAFSKKSRGIAAIHFSDACTKKEQRLHGENLHVYSFIPTYLLKEGIPHKMDPFLKPLIDEVTELYIKGIDIHIAQEIECNHYTIQEGNHKVRALLLLGTADLKAHQEIVLYAGGTVYSNCTHK